MGTGDEISALQLRTIVKDIDAGARLDCYLAKQSPTYTRSQISDWIKRGLVRSARVILLKPSYRVKSDQSIELTLPPSVPQELAPEAIPLRILYEDEDIMIIDKQSGLPVHPPPGHLTNSLVNALLHHCGAYLRQVGEPSRPGIVHRLDKNTTGLLVVAKTPSAYRILVKQFSARQVHRTYLAFVWGIPPEVGRWENMLARSKFDRLKMAVTTNEGKLAVTDYELIDTWRGAVSLVKLYPLTGRTHQLRLQCCWHGYPIVGDPTYGRGRLSLQRKMNPLARAYLVDCKRQLLHATSISLRHPSRQALMTWHAPLPADMQKFQKLQNLGSSANNGL